jgi:hypothetical protein
MLGEYGETLVVDWGLARLLDRPDPEQTAAERPVLAGFGNDFALTEVGHVVGTIAFMPPEQAKGRLDQLGPPSDVFSLGATLYTILTGHAPYEGSDVLVQAATADVVPARQRKRCVPAALEAVCARAMAAKPQDRYPSAKALAEDVQQWLGDEPVSVYQESLPRIVVKWSKREPVKAIVAAAFLGVATIDLLSGVLLLARQSEPGFLLLVSVIFGPLLFAFITMSFGNVLAILSGLVGLIQSGQSARHSITRFGLLGLATGTFAGGFAILFLCCDTMLTLWSPSFRLGGLRTYNRLPDLLVVAVSGVGVGLAFGITCSLIFRLTKGWTSIVTITTVIACSVASATMFTMLLMPIRLN